MHQGDTAGDDFTYRRRAGIEHVRVDQLGDAQFAGPFNAKGMRVAADLAANDALLDAMAISRGRIVVSMPGMAALVMPAWPEAARAVEDCRI